MNNYIRAVLFLMVVVIVATAFKCSGKNDGIYRGTLSEKNIEFTPKGVRVASGQKINKALFASIDAGLADLFRIASNPPNSYPIPRTYTDYNVWLLPRSDKCINAGFLVDATGSPYEGSEFDKDPSPNRCLICAAGMTMFSGGVVGNPARPGMIVVDDPATIRTVVRYEGEHSLLFYVDRHRYNATMYHPPPHPILGDGGASFSAADNVPKAVSANVEGKNYCVLVTK